MYTAQGIFQCAPVKEHFYNSADDEYVEDFYATSTQPKQNVWNSGFYCHPHASKDNTKTHYDGVTKSGCLQKCGNNCKTVTFTKDPNDKSRDPKGDCVTHSKGYQQCTTSTNPDRFVYSKLPFPTVPTTVSKFTNFAGYENYTNNDMEEFYATAKPEQLKRNTWVEGHCPGHDLGKPEPATNKANCLQKCSGDKCKGVVFHPPNPKNPKDTKGECYLKQSMTECDNKDGAWYYIKK